ncbi:hypothetical protein BDW68DRAFT_150241 [Aspergillus falconensis]
MKRAGLSSKRRTLPRTSQACRGKWERTLCYCLAMTVVRSRFPCKKFRRTCLKYPHCTSQKPPKTTMACRSFSPCCAA